MANSLVAVLCSIKCSVLSIKYPQKQKVIARKKENRWLASLAILKRSVYIAWKFLINKKCFTLSTQKWEEWNNFSEMSSSENVLFYVLAIFTFLSVYIHKQQKHLIVFVVGSKHTSCSLKNMGNASEKQKKN